MTLWPRGYCRNGIFVVVTMHLSLGHQLLNRHLAFNDGISGASFVFYLCYFKLALSSDKGESKTLTYFLQYLMSTGGQN